MAVTVGWLARQGALGLTVVAGAGHADREILWAHAIELADPAPYLSGGELVMTTGIVIGQSRRSQHDYVSRLVAAGAAALAFDTGTTFTRVPDGIVTAGDELGLPVLAVPAATPFIAITRAVIDRINADQVKAVRRTVEAQGMLARETLGGGIPALLTALGRTLSGTAVLVSADGRPLAAAGPEQERVAGLASALRLRTASNSRVVADGDGYCMLQALRPGATTRGHLLVALDRAPSDADRLLVAHTVALIGIELEKPRRVLDAEQQLRSAVTHALVRSPSLVDPALLRHFGFRPDTAVTAVIFGGFGPALAAQAAVRQAVERAGTPYLSGLIDDDLLLVLASGDHDQIDVVHNRLCRALDRPVRAGVSAAGGIGDVAMLLRQARAAAGSGDGASVSWYTRRRGVGALLADRTPEDLAALSAVLDPLDDDLLATLAAFLDHNGHLENAAAALGVHRHTMRNRLGRIAELLDLALDSADNRAWLLVATRARALLA